MTEKEDLVQVLWGELLLGNAQLRLVDEGMAVLGGAFRPTSEYLKVQRIFISIAQAEDDPETLKGLYAEREALCLSVMRKDKSIICGNVHINDFTDIDPELDLELIVFPK